MISGFSDDEVSNFDLTGEALIEYTKKADQKLQLLQR